METSINASKENNKDNESIKSYPFIQRLKSDYFLQKLYDNMPKKKKLEIANIIKRYKIE